VLSWRQNRAAALEMCLGELSARATFLSMRARARRKNGRPGRIWLWPLGRRAQPGPPSHGRIGRTR
jgi:hypothetical protein